MPVVLNTSSFGSVRPPEQQRNLWDIEYDYKYPLGNALRPGTALHEKLRQEVLVRAMLSHGAMSQRHDGWRKIDETMTAYIPTTEAEQKLQSEDPNKPVSLVVPLSYAVLETLLAYVVAAFLENPVFKYEGVGPEDELGSALLERLIDQQVRRMRMGLQVHTMFRDAFCYGAGWLTPQWSQIYAYQTRPVEKGFFSAVSGWLGTGATKQRERVLKFETNELYNIDPYSILPDTAVGVTDTQRGEYIGWIRRESLSDVLSREFNDPSYFNGKYVKHITGLSVLGEDQSARDRYSVKDSVPPGAQASRPVDVTYMYIKIIPAEWGLGQKDYPEKWVFGLAGDQVLITAGPTNLDHDMFPVVSCAPDYDGYGVTPISRLEMVYGLQHLANFLYNSHVANVRKAVNDMLVVDPSLINMEDLKRPAPGKLIRLRKKAWGHGVKDAVMQLNVTDITRSNVDEVAGLTRLLDMITGTTDAVKGVVRGGGERVTAAEFQGTQTAALNRIEKAARIGGMQALQPLGYMLASNVQQFLEREQYVRLMGNSEEVLRKRFGDAKRVLVNPMDVLVDADIIVGDGSLPNSGDPYVWSQVLQIVGANPLLAQQFDVVRIFEHFASLAGAKNISDFTKPMQAQVMPDEQVAQMAQAGNVVPVGAQR